MRHVLLVAGILGGGIPALAQPATTANPAVPAFQDTLVVSASLEPETRQETPASVTVISGQEIEDRQVTTLADAVSLAPGVTVAQSGSPGQQTSLFLRGAESDQTLLLWNGIPLNDPYFGGANWQFVPTDGVERVEVVRGPFSALYGSNAVGGVVQVLTGTRQGGTLRLEGGENDYRRAALTAGADMGSLRLDAIGHVRRGNGVLDNDFFDSEELVTRGLWTLQPGISLGLLARANDSDTGIPFSGATATPHRTISWQEREVAVPFSASRGSWEVAAQVSRTTFNSAYRDPDDPFGFTASDTKSEGLHGRTVVTWHAQEGFWISGGTEVETHRASGRTSTARASAPGPRSARRATARVRCASTSACAATTTTSTAARPACAPGRWSTRAVESACGRATGRRFARRRSASCSSPAAAIRLCGRRPEPPGRWGSSAKPAASAPRSPVSKPASAT
jgi:outer membrane receptor protein involved in Fe transport